MGQSILEQMSRDEESASHGSGASVGRPDAGSPEEGSHDGSTSQAPQTAMLSMMGGGRGGPEDLPEADDFAFVDQQKHRGRLLSQSTLLIVALCAIAGGALYVMRMSQRDMQDGPGAEVEAQIELALAKLSRSHADGATSGAEDADPELTRTRGGTLDPENLRSLFRDTNEVLAMFSFDPGQWQVPPKFLARNPFALNLRKTAPEGQSERRAAAARAERMAELQREFEQLSLRTIMHGRVPIAIINGSLLQKNQSIGPFTIRQIGELSVTLTAEGETFELKMQNDAKRNTAPDRGSYRR